MKLFDVYPIMDIEPIKGEGSFVYDSEKQRYLDLYGGHAVISVGHSHPYYVKKISDQLKQIGFYSNSVKIELQKDLAKKLGELSGYPDYSLFLCNSGAEANENALKLASFYNGKSKVVAFKGAFHGRTAGAVAVTDNPGIAAPVNDRSFVTFLPLNDACALEERLAKKDVSAVIIEGIQGVSGINVPTDEFLKDVQAICARHEVILILDEVQSGYGRTGKFFYHQYAGITPDLITVAKGMGNGFPIGGVLINPKFIPKYGMLGTTFGGNHLACAAGIAVLDIIKEENLLFNAEHVGNYLKIDLKFIKKIKKIKGKGLMLGLEFDFPVNDLRKKMVEEEHIFTGAASDPNVMRLLPPLSLARCEAEMFLTSLSRVLNKMDVDK